MPPAGQRAGDFQDTDREPEVAGREYRRVGSRDQPVRERGFDCAPADDDTVCVRMEILTRGGGLWFSNPRRAAANTEWTSGVTPASHIRANSRESRSKCELENF